MAHILHAGGPWKLESLCRSQETGVNMEACQANKVPGGWVGTPSRWVLESPWRLGVPIFLPKPPPLFTNTEQSWAGPEKGLE